jgi:hypothetical protein
MAKPLPWSHSSLAGFATCARQYEEIKVLRNFQDQKNDQSIWGDRFHTMAEEYIKARVAAEKSDVNADAPVTLPLEMQQYEKYLEQFVRRSGETLAEQEYGLDIHLKPCAFLGSDVWMRGIIDVLTLESREAWVDDHKTGKRKKDMQQLIIFALLAFYHHPEVDTVHTAFHWVAVPDPVHGYAKDTETFHRRQIDDLWATLTPKLKDYARAFHSGVFQAKPSGLCKRHCAVNTCEYWGRGGR